MKCLVCERFSLSHICKHCQHTFLSPALYRRTLESGINVFSFYMYEEIKELLFTKHTDLGYYMYNILAKNSFQKFAEHFLMHRDVFVSIAIDDDSSQNYSHTAILNHALKSYNIHPLYNKLRATNKVQYSGKSKAFRELNPRGFRLKKFNQKEGVILVDDIITTGTTLNEAIEVLQKDGKEVVFCLTLCDVSLEK